MLGYFTLPRCTTVRKEGNTNSHLRRGKHREEHGVMRLSAMPAYQLAPLLRKGEVSPVEVIRETIENIEKFDDRLNAHITVLREEALREARTAEKDIAAGNYKGLLHGIP